MDDYFHTGAGARYLRRADEDVVVESLRGNITLAYPTRLRGCGGILVAGGVYGGSGPRLRKADRFGL